MSFAAEISARDVGDLPWASVCKGAFFWGCLLRITLLEPTREWFELSSRVKASEVNSMWPGSPVVRITHRGEHRVLFLLVPHFSLEIPWPKGPSRYPCNSSPPLTEPAGPYLPARAHAGEMQGGFRLYQRDGQSGKSDLDEPEHEETLVQILVSGSS